MTLMRWRLSMTELMAGEGDVRPLILADPDGATWDACADVVVVGFGAAGAAASLHAVEGGASVIALDRFKGGGASAFSGGVVYAGGTNIQREAGYDDNADTMATYLQQEVGNVVSADTIKRYSAQSAGNIAWLEKQGVKFGSELFKGKTTYPPEGKFLYFSGNEKVEANAQLAKPAPRGHRTRGTGFTGKYLLAAMTESAVRKGVVIRGHAWVRRLVVDANGKVIGVEVIELPENQHAAHQKLYDAISPMVPFKEAKAERNNAAARKMESEHGDIKLIRARHGVVLSTGGYVYNLPMLKKYAPILGDNYTAIMRMGSLGDDGSADRLGRSVGAESRLLDNMFIGRVLSPPPSLLNGILVNRDGQRFVNEAIYLGSLGKAIADQPEGRAWLIIPRTAYRSAIKEVLTGGLPLFKLFGLPALLNMMVGGTRKAKNLTALADKCGLERDALLRSIDRYNELANTRHDDDFNKLAEHMVRIEDGPCVALNTAITNRYSFTQVFSLGGLPVDEETGSVKRPDETRVEGLYAAGRAAIGLPSNRYISGLSLGDCIFSGRRAAQACLESRGHAVTLASVMRLRTACCPDRGDRSWVQHQGDNGLKGHPAGKCECRPPCLIVLET
jgi:3-oxo-5alpha-steroid 4-dehydrogenase